MYDDNNFDFTDSIDSSEEKTNELEPAYVFKLNPKIYKPNNKIKYNRPIH